MKNFFNPSPDIRPYLNLGCLFDIPTGRYHIGEHGESILNGGLSFFTGIGGRGNMFKSVLAHWMILRCLDRYHQSAANVYDTETTLTFDRLYQLAMTMESIAGLDLKEEGRLVLTDNTVYSGNEWFAKFREFVNDKKKNKKEYLVETPFMNKAGERIKSALPSLFELDSLSMFTTDSVEAIYTKNEIGDSAANTDALRSAAAKNQMLMQLPTLTGSSNNYLIATAHVGDKHQLDPYAPNVKKLSFLKGNSTFKNVPEKFSFLTNNLWYCLAVNVLQNQATKGPEYPKNPEDVVKGDTDLQILTVQNLRAKAGPTGMPFELIISQREGVLVGLSEFNYIKQFNRYGLGGHDRSYYLELVPDVSMQRTTVRFKIDEHPQVRRALEFTSEMCQMDNLHFEQTVGYLVEPKSLYENLKSLGYDWDILLDTRGYWVFGDDSKEKPFLSTLDLLKMNKGEYHPWWYNKVAKSLGKPEIKLGK
jgi:hypothetical protein